MGIYEELSIASDSHAVAPVEGGIRIFAIAPTQEGVERFQPIADKAIENDGDGYTVQLAHEISTLSEKLYDFLILFKDEEEEDLNAVMDDLPERPI